MRLAQKSLAALLLASLLSGCPKREEIRAHMWMQSGIPASVCQANPAVAKSGLYRRLNDVNCPAGKAPPCYEFVSYCSPQVVHYLSILDSEFNTLLDQYIGPDQQKKAALMSGEAVSLDVN